MPSTDPIADLLAAISNASLAHLDTARVTDSKLRQAVLKVLHAEGFVRSYRVVGDRAGRRVLEVHLAFGPRRERLFNGAKRVSRPGRRVYVDLAGLKPYLRRLEVSVLSTSQGVMSGAQAFARNLGGELLCLVW
jgi:small subunit ribosomal protein S8